MSIKKTLLIDGNNCLFRHNFTSNLTAPNGQKVSGVFGMFKDVAALMREYKPDQVIVCWDKGRAVRRIKLYPEYKGNRKDRYTEEEIENMRFQKDVARKIWDCLPVKQIRINNMEADDVIGFFCKKIKGKKIIASNDTDFIQLINKDTMMVSSRRGVVRELTHENASEFLGFDYTKYVLHKSMTGDSSDNIKGVGGIGPKRATQIINGELKKDMDKEILKRNMKLIKICHLFTKDDYQSIADEYKTQKGKKPNLMKLRALFTKLKFNSILTNFVGFTHGFKRIYELEIKELENGKKDNKKSK